MDRVRHEAGEALGAIGTAECFDLLRQHEQDPCLEVAQTCQLALQRIQHFTAGGSSGRADQLASTSDAASDGPECSLQCGQSCQQTGDTTDSSESPYLSVDPAPAAPASTPTPHLRSVLINEEAPIFKRYRALFALRNKGGRDEVRAFMLHCNPCLVCRPLQLPTPARISLSLIALSVLADCCAG